MTRLARQLIAAFLAAASLAAFAGDYPSRPIKIVTGYAPGAPPDLVARFVAPRLAAALGQPVIVENRPGAGATLGAAAVKTAAPDGYTLLASGTSDLAVAPAMSARIQYDPLKDFSPIVLAANHPFWMLVDPTLAAGSVRSLVDYTRSNAGRVSYASAGVGNLTHLAGEQFKAATGADMNHVPYKGGTAAMTDVMGGRVAMYIGPIQGSQQLVADGKLRALAVTGSARSALAPDIPTMAEAGFPGLEFIGITALLAPAATPPEIIERLNREINAILSDPQARRTLAAQSAEPAGGTPEQLRARISADIGKWTAVVRAAGIKAE